MADAIVPTAVEKPCTKCGRVLPLMEFSPDKRTALGVGSYCKGCNRQRMKGYTAANREKIKVRNREYHAKNKAKKNADSAAYYHAHRDEINSRRREATPERRQMAIAAQVKYRAENSEYIRLRSKLYYQRNKDAHRERLKKWRKENPSLFKAQLKRRRARLLGASEVTLTAEEWAGIVAAYEGRCFYCGCKPETITQDHIIPLSKGGQHTAANVVPACQPCNSSKGDKEL